MVAHNPEPVIRRRHPVLAAGHSPDKLRADATSRGRGTATPSAKTPSGEGAFATVLADRQKRVVASW